MHTGGVKGNAKSDIKNIEKKHIFCRVHRNRFGFGRSDLDMIEKSRTFVGCNEMKLGCNKMER